MVSNLSEGAAREWSTLVDIFKTLPSFKPILLFLSRSPLSKTPKQVFFNPIHIFVTFTTLFYYYQFYFFRLTFKILFLQDVSVNVEDDSGGDHTHDNDWWVLFLQDKNMLDTLLPGLRTRLITLAEETNRLHWGGQAITNQSKHTIDSK